MSLSVAILPEADPAQLGLKFGAGVGVGLGLRIVEGLKDKRIVLEGERCKAEGLNRGCKSGYRPLEERSGGNFW